MRRFGKWLLAAIVAFALLLPLATSASADPGNGRGPGGGVELTSSSPGDPGTGGP